MTREAAGTARDARRARSNRSNPKTVGKEDPAFYEALGRAIKVARTELGMERKDLAERANVSYAYLSDIETGRGRPGSRSLLAIAEALGRSVGELMHEAELFRRQIAGAAMEASQEPFRRMAEPMSPPSARRWFHEQASAELAASAPPASREFRQAWRERLAETEAEARTELHAIVDRLSPEDLDAALTIARRLVDPDR